MTPKALLVLHTIVSVVALPPIFFSITKQLKTLKLVHYRKQQ